MNKKKWMEIRIDRCKGKKKLMTEKCKKKKCE